MAKKYKKKRSKYPGYMSFNKGLGLNPAYGEDGGKLYYQQDIGNLPPNFGKETFEFNKKQPLEFGKKPLRFAPARFIETPPTGLKKIEKDVNEYLGYPMRKAFEETEALAPENEDPADNLRHGLAGMYTGEAIANKFPKLLQDYTPIPKVAGFLGSNILGVGHELAALQAAYQNGEVQNLGTELRESGEDLYNNLVGSYVSALPFATTQQKANLLRKMSDKNLLPDGVYDVNGRNLYFKKSESDPGSFAGYKKEQGGWLDELPTEYQQGGRTPIYVDDPNHPRLLAYNDSASVYNNYANLRDIITRGGRYYINPEISRPVITNRNSTFYVPNPNNPIVLRRVTDDFSFNEISDRGLPNIKVSVKSKIKPIATETYTRKESKYKSEKDYKKAAENIRDFNERTGEANWIGYDIQRYKQPVQPYIYRKPEVVEDQIIYVDDPNDPRLIEYNKRLELSNKYPMPSKSNFMTRSNSNSEWFKNQVNTFKQGNIEPIGFDLSSVNKDNLHNPVFEKPKVKVILRSDSSNGNNMETVVLPDGTIKRIGIIDQKRDLPLKTVSFQTEKAKIIPPRIDIQELRNIPLPEYNRFIGTDQIKNISKEFGRDWESTSGQKAPERINTSTGLSEGRYGDYYTISHGDNTSTLTPQEFELFQKTKEYQDYKLKKKQKGGWLESYQFKGEVKKPSFLQTGKKDLGTLLNELKPKPKPRMYEFNTKPVSKQEALDAARAQDNTRVAGFEQPKPDLDLGEKYTTDVAETVLSPFFAAKRVYDNPDKYAKTLYNALPYAFGYMGPALNEDEVGQAMDIAEVAGSFAGVYPSRSVANQSIRTLKNLKELERNATIKLLNSKPALNARKKIIDKLIPTVADEDLFKKQTLERLKKFGRVNTKSGFTIQDAANQSLVDLMNSKDVGGYGTLRNYLRDTFIPREKTNKSWYLLQDPKNTFSASVDLPRNDINKGSFNSFMFFDSKNPVRAGKTALQALEFLQPGMTANPGSLSGDSFPLWMNIVNKKLSLPNNQYSVLVNDPSLFNLSGQKSNLSTLFNEEDYLDKLSSGMIGVENKLNEKGTQITKMIDELTRKGLQSRIDNPKAQDAISNVNYFNTSPNVAGFYFPNITLKRNFRKGGWLNEL